MGQPAARAHPRGRQGDRPAEGDGRESTFFFSRLRSFLSITPRICFMASVCTEVMLPPDACGAAAAAAAAGAASPPGPALPLLLAMVLLVAEGISV